jgi:uncharacterized damage-inducible protein DinB
MTSVTPVTENTVPLTVVYRGWDGFNHELVKVIAPLSSEQLALPVAPHHWSLGHAIQHIVTDRAWWFHAWMGEGGEDMVALGNWDGEGQPVRSPAELVAALESTWAMIEHALARWTVGDLAHIFPQPDTLTERERSIFGPISRQEIIWHVHSHDLHHAGELAMGLGGYQLPTLSGWGG